MSLKIKFVASNAYSYSRSRRFLFMMVFLLLEWPMFTLHVTWSFELNEMIACDIRIIPAREKLSVFFWHTQSKDVSISYRVRRLRNCLFARKVSLQGLYGWETRLRRRATCILNWYIRSCLLHRKILMKHCIRTTKRKLRGKISKKTNIRWERTIKTKQILQNKRR